MNLLTKINEEEIEIEEERTVKVRITKTQLLANKAKFEKQLADVNNLLAVFS